MPIRPIAFGLLFLLWLSGCATRDSQDAPTTTTDELVSLADSDSWREVIPKSYALSKSWLLSNLQSKGLFVYLYDADKKEVSRKNNELRQLMASRLLAELSGEDPSLLPLHRKNLNFVFGRWYRETPDGLGYIFYNQKSKLGGNAMALRTLAYSPFYEDYRDKAKKIANGILSLMSENGAFEPWFIAPSYAYDKDYLLTFYSGEAIVSLVEYANKSGDTRALEAAIRAENFYLDRYVTHLADHYYPAYVPWHTLALNKLYQKTNDRRYLDAIFVLNDKLLELQDTRIFIGRFYNPATPQYGKPHASSDGVYTESLAYAYEAARWAGDLEHMNRYETAIRLSLKNLVSLQWTADRVKGRSDSQSLLGAFRIRDRDSRLRVDNVQHVMDAYRKLIPLLKSDATSTKN